MVGCASSAASDVLVVRVVALAADRVGGDAVRRDERRCGRVLRRQRIARGQHDVRAARLQGAHEVRGLGRDVQARRDGVDRPAVGRARSVRGSPTGPAWTGPPTRSGRCRPRRGRGRRTSWGGRSDTRDPCAQCERAGVPRAEQPPAYRGSRVALPAGARRRGPGSLRRARPGASTAPSRHRVRPAASGRGPRSCRAPAGPRRHLCRRDRRAPTPGSAFRGARGRSPRTPS